MEIMKAVPVAIDWHPGLPVFAAEPVLKAVGDEYGWLGGVDDSGRLRCFLPYTVIRKALVRLVRFRMETVPLDGALDVAEETAFLNGAVAYFRSRGDDVIVPATNNAVFRAYPDDAEAAPYGSYVIDLTQSEETLWRNLSRLTRRNVGAAQKEGVVIRSGSDLLDTAYRLIHETFGRSRLPFMDYRSFQRFVAGLGAQGEVLVAEHEGIVHSAVVFAFSDPCVYAVYGGNIAEHHKGANKLIYWDAITRFRQRGVARFDFYGARVDPPKGSKHEAINAVKQQFGATLVQGYMWKYRLRPVKALAYSLGVRLLRGGDIVDLERHKLTAGPAAMSACRANS
jgi:hypothetical protein